MPINPRVSQAIRRTAKEASKASPPVKAVVIGAAWGNASNIFICDVNGAQVMAESTIDAPIVTGDVVWVVKTDTEKYIIQGTA